MTFRNMNRLSREGISCSLLVSRCNSTFLFASIESRCCPADIGDSRKITVGELVSGSSIFCEVNMFLVSSVRMTNDLAFRTLDFEAEMHCS